MHVWFKTLQIIVVQCLHMFWVTVYDSEKKYRILQSIEQNRGLSAESCSVMSKITDGFHFSD